jgi:hypothetical protein
VDSSLADGKKEGDKDMTTKITREMYIDLMAQLGYQLNYLGDGFYRCINLTTGFDEAHEIDDIHKHVLEDIYKHKDVKTSEMTDKEREALSRELTDVANVDQSVINSLSFIGKKNPGVTKNTMFKAALEANKYACHNLTELADYVVRASDVNWKSEEGEA